MSLITCSECGKEFSDKAAACPNCGCPTESMIHSDVAVRRFDDVFSANKVMSTMCKGAIKCTRELLAEDENVLFASIFNAAIENVSDKLSGKLTAKGKLTGVFTITSRRVLFVNSALGNGITKQILIEDITSIDTKHTLVVSQVRIVGITEMFVIDMSRDEQKVIMNVLNTLRK